MKHYICSLVPRPPLSIPHTASDQKPEEGKAWEQGYHACKRKEKGEWGGEKSIGKEELYLYLNGKMYQETFQQIVFPSAQILNQTTN